MPLETKDTQSAQNAGMSKTIAAEMLQELLEDWADHLASALLGEAKLGGKQWIKSVSAHVTYRKVFRTIAGDEERYRNYFFNPVKRAALAQHAAIMEEALEDIAALEEEEEAKSQ